MKGREAAVSRCSKNPNSPSLERESAVAGTAGDAASTAAAMSVGGPSCRGRFLWGVFAMGFSVGVFGWLVSAVVGSCRAERQEEFRLSKAGQKRRVSGSASRVRVVSLSRAVEPVQAEGAL